MNRHNYRFRNNEHDSYFYIHFLQCVLDLSYVFFHSRGFLGIYFHSAFRVFFIKYGPSTNHLEYCWGYDRKEALLEYLCFCSSFSFMLFAHFLILRSRFHECHTQTHHSLPSSSSRICFRCTRLVFKFGRSPVQRHVIIWHFQCACHLHLPLVRRLYMVAHIGSLTWACSPSGRLLSSPFSFATFELERRDFAWPTQEGRVICLVRGPCLWISESRVDGVVE